MIKTLICDDDITIVEQVAGYLESESKNRQLEFSAEKYTDPLKIPPDAVFDIAIIDIEMPGMGGIELGIKLKKNNPSVLIFILTSYISYIDEAMRLEVFRYLTKPLSYERFSINISDALLKLRETSGCIVVKTKNEIHRVDIKDILSFEIIKNGSKIITKNGELLTYKKIDQWVSETKRPLLFAYCHKSFCVNLANVSKITDKTVLIKTADNKFTEIPISQRYLHSFKNAFWNYVGGVKI